MRLLHGVGLLLVPSLVLILLSSAPPASAFGGSWSQIPDLPVARGVIAAVWMDGNLYAIGGFNGGPLNEVDVYNSTSGTWIAETGTNSPRTDSAVAAVDGRIYVIGGARGGNTTMEIFDPLSHVWTQRWGTIRPREFLTAQAVGGKIYAIGGYDRGNQTTLDSVEVFDPLTGIWTMKASMSNSRYAMPSVSIGTKIYVFGGGQLLSGSVNGTVLSSVEVYDTVSDHWSQLPCDMPVAKASAGAAAIYGRIFLFGGGPDQSPYTDTYELVLDSQTACHWEEGPYPPVGRSGIFNAVAVLNSNAYLLGGYNELAYQFGGTGSYLKSVDVFSVQAGSTPTVNITSPTSSGTWETHSMSVDLGGVAFDSSGVKQVSWYNEATGKGGTAVGTQTWTASVTLKLGLNSITVQAINAAQASGTDLILVTVTPASPPAVNITVPTSSPLWNTSDDSIDLEGTASDVIHVDSVTWFNAATMATGVAVGDVSWSATVPLVYGPNTISITVHAVNGRSASASITVNRPLPVPSTESNPYLVPAAGAAVAGGVVMGGLFGPQIFLMLAGAAFPVYSRFKKDRLDDNEVRSMVRTYIRTHPSSYYGDIKRGLSLPNGQLMYHLQRLEKGGAIRSKREGRFKRFYPMEVGVMKELPILNKTQRDILETILEVPGVSQAELAYALDESKQNVSHHVGELADKGLVRLRFMGKTSHVYLADGVEDTMTAGPSKEGAVYEAPEAKAEEKTTSLPAQEAQTRSRAVGAMAKAVEEEVGAKMRALADLRDSGTITQEEYVRKRDEILKEF